MEGERAAWEGLPPASHLPWMMKDGTGERTWEPAINVSEDLIRQYEEKWWTAARKVRGR